MVPGKSQLSFALPETSQSRAGPAKPRLAQVGH